MPKWQWILKTFGSKLWLRATFFCLLGIFTALFAFLVKDFIPNDIAGKVGVDAVDSILHIIASSMLAVTTFSLSTMVAAHAAASSSATPRAVTLLLEDRTAQNALSIFIGSFLYSLVGIIALQIGIYGESGRLILFVVTLGVVFVITASLLTWIDHLSHLGRVGETIDVVERTTAQALQQRLDEPYLGGTRLEQYVPAISHHAITHSQIGYIQNIDMQRLSDLAEDHEMEIFIRALPGAFSDSSKPVAYISTPPDEKLLCLIRDAIVVNGNRSFEQDPRYGLIVLNEIGARALSPAVNDYGTAIDVIGTAVRLLIPWASQDPAGISEVHFPRVHVPALFASDLYDDIFGSLARDGAGMLEVTLRLQKAYASLAAIGNEECIEQSRRYSALTLKYAQHALILDEEKEALEALVASPGSGVLS
ncbi:MAG: DUF2254 domain-containing protein [Alphaproteobacteria bacterium]|nr:DUF2254 domain-containing protein [Alphaproteobacteria bacterium]